MNELDPLFYKNTLKIVKTRKEHECLACQTTIKKGSRARFIKQFAKYENKYKSDSFYTHDYVCVDDEGNFIENIEEA